MLVTSLSDSGSVSESTQAPNFSRTPLRTAASPSPHGEKVSSQRSPSGCFPPRPRRTRCMLASGNPLLWHRVVSSTLRWLPSVPWQATERCEGRGKLFIVKAITQGPPTVIREPHRVTALMSKPSSGEVLPRQASTQGCYGNVGEVFGCHHNTRHRAPLKGRARTSGLEAQGCSFWKVSRKTLLAVRLFDKGK